jgi:hypothetical protein
VDRVREDPNFTPKAFVVFFLINLACFYWALLTAYPERLHGMKAVEYTMTGIPVSLLGAVFDIVTLGIIIWAVNRALATRNNLVFLAYLSVDFIIAVVATLWVVFAFYVSGWLVAQVLPINDSFAQRTELYHDRVAGVFLHPLAAESLKNVYFGLILSGSSMLPSIAHVVIAVGALAKIAHQRIFATGVRPL